MKSDPILAEIAEDLRTRHGCHTAILYGSRAAGDARLDSDYDLAGFGSTAKTFRDARKWRGAYIDAFVHPEARLLEATRDLLHLRDGVVLFEKDAAGTKLLGRLEEVFRAGPERLSDDEIAARRVWAWKMLERARHSDIEADYRRAWLLMALLEDYFALRNLWYLGPKASFQWLAANDEPAHAAFVESLRPGASLESIGRLVQRVAGRAP